MDKLIEGLITSGIPAVVILFGLYLGKNLMEHFFNETIEIKKQELEQESKNFQHQLDAKLQEFNIKFTSLHQERAIVIKDLYHKIIELQSSMYNYTRKVHLVKSDAKIEEKERLERVNKALSELTNFYYPNKIYFSKSITSKIDELLKEYWNTGFEFTNHLKITQYPHIYKTLNKNNNEDQWDIISKKVETYFPPLIQELEDDFREILGVKN